MHRAPVGGGMGGRDRLKTLIGIETTINLGYWLHAPVSRSA